LSDYLSSLYTDIQDLQRITKTISNKVLSWTSIIANQVPQDKFRDEILKEEDSVRMAKTLEI
jgi:hypothetical protein